MFPASTAERDDFEQVVRAVDEMFFSEECSTIWCLGVEGTTYTMDGDKIVYSDDLTKFADGIYKTMQVKYAAARILSSLCGSTNAKMSKYDENYAQINKTVAGMEDGNVIQPLPRRRCLTT